MMNNTPWCEKYRPTQLESIVLDPVNKKIFENILDRNCFPHLLFYGPPGVGKTTTADNLITKYQKKYSKLNKETIIHLNASDERGIEVIRNQINQFVKSNNMFAHGLKFVILDEVDYMTKNAQQALKNLLQTCLSNVRFVLICNYICKIDESLQKEFTCIRFNQLPSAEIIYLIQTIVKKEDIKLRDESITTIQDMFQSDIRSMINYIQLNHNTIDVSEQLFHNNVCKELLQKLKLNDSGVKQWIFDISKKYCIDTKSIVTKFANYIMKHEKQYITNDFLNIIEVVIHCPDGINLDYFVNRIKHLKS